MDENELYEEVCRVRAALGLLKEHLQIGTSESISYYAGKVAELDFKKLKKLAKKARNNG